MRYSTRQLAKPRQEPPALPTSGAQTPTTITRRATAAYRVDTACQHHARQLTRKSNHPRGESQQHTRGNHPWRQHRILRKKPCSHPADHSLLHTLARPNIPAAQPCRNTQLTTQSPCSCPQTHMHKRLSQREKVAILTEKDRFV